MESILILRSVLQDYIINHNMSMKFDFKKNDEVLKYETLVR